MRIKELLKEKRLTQQELADKMNVSLSAVKQMVSAGSLTTATLEKIATALDVPMWQLFASPEEVLRAEKLEPVYHVDVSVEQSRSGFLQVVPLRPHPIAHEHGGHHGDH